MGQSLNVTDNGITEANVDGKEDTKKIEEMDISISREVASPYGISKDDNITSTSDMPSSSTKDSLDNKKAASNISANTKSLKQDTDKGNCLIM